MGGAVLACLLPPSPQCARLHQELEELDTLFYRRLPTVLVDIILAFSGHRISVSLGHCRSYYLDR